MTPLVGKPALYDAHCHFDSFSKEEQTTTVNRMKENGVKGLFTNSTSFASNEKNLTLAQQNPCVHPSLGIYPLDLLELTDGERERALSFIETHAHEAVGIGEVGMDFKFSTKKEEQELQEKYFRKFIQLALKVNKPIIVHTRYAESQCIKVLESEGAKKVLLHSFTSSQKLMLRAAEKGYFVSVGMGVTYNENVQNNIRDFPLEKLLFETDAPLTLREGKYFSDSVLLVAQKVAQLKNIPLEEVIKQQENNIHTLFGQI